MGQTGSGLAHKVMSPFQWWKSDASKDHLDRGTALSHALVSPFVYTRRSSMYIDEDGDIAHEFYEEHFDRKSKRFRMKRLKKNLVPQGEVELPYPRLHMDLPVVLCDANFR